MKCPICNNKKGIEIDMHSDGYAGDVLECDSCGTLWSAGIEGTVLLNNKVA